MDTLVDSINQTLNENALELIRKIFPAAQFLYRAKTKKESYDHIVKAVNHFSGRRKFIIITDAVDYAEIDDNKYIVNIQNGNIENICNEIALSSERIAAIIIFNHYGSSFFRKKMRELASAEGAFLIIDETNQTEIASNYSISKSCLPDMILFIWQTIFWLGSKLEI